MQLYSSHVFQSLLVSPPCPTMSPLPLPTSPYPCAPSLPSLLYIPPPCPSLSLSQLSIRPRQLTGGAATLIADR